MPTYGTAICPRMYKMRTDGWSKRWYRSSGAPWCRPPVYKRRKAHARFPT